MLCTVLALSLLLTSRNHFCKVEVARVFGNLTRSATVRNYLLETNGENNLLIFKVFGITVISRYIKFVMYTVQLIYWFLITF